MVQVGLKSYLVSNYWDHSSFILELSVLALLCKACQAPLGMESGAISDAQISASSQWNSNHAAIQGRLNFKAGGGKQGGWSALHNDQNQWLQADLGSSKQVTYFATQGRNAYSQWVTSYKVEYSNDGSSFQYYQEQGADKVCELAYTICCTTTEGPVVRILVRSLDFLVILDPDDLLNL